MTLRLMDDSAACANVSCDSPSAPLPMIHHVYSKVIAQGVHRQVSPSTSIVILGPGVPLSCVAQSAIGADLLGDRVHEEDVPDKLGMDGASLRVCLTYSVVGAILTTACTECGPGASRCCPCSARRP